ncbi:uncharacterized protein LOC135841724 [Planococcus citri]|uniref:uncharacterized protein LOC135841724 n=1 Tax=Planococcus citri TaxID=170843 RepID=UPI0031F96D5A
MNQYKVMGSVVNVPVDVPDNVSVLPRSFEETRVIPIVLKKRKSHKSNVMFETVSPVHIFDALKCLQNCEVYKLCNVEVNLDKDLNINSNLVQIANSEQENGIDNNLMDVAVSEENASNILQTDINVNNNSLQAENPSNVLQDDETVNAHPNENCSDDDDDDDNDNGGGPIHITEQETLLQDNQALIFAPGEDKTPISLILDPNAEEMTFIKIYGGNIRQPVKHLKYHEIVKSEIMRSDRRCANVMKLLYCALKIRILRISGCIGFQMRKFKNQKQYSKENLLDENFIRELILHDEGFRVFKNDRGNPAFFEEKKKELFAMIRQLGPALLFLTLSAAETRWLPLLVILKKVVDNETITEDEAEQLNYIERVRLINTDPVTCARYFEHRVREMFRLLKNKNGIFDEHNVRDYYIRTEFQHRGSPHVHTLLWLNDAPIYDCNDEISIQNCIKFIDKYLTCDDQDIDKTLLSYQIHKHTRTCERMLNGMRLCRFNIPYMPMPETRILEPLPKDFDKELKKNYIKKYNKIRHYLNSVFRQPPDDTIEEFFSKNEIMDINEYIMIIRSSLHTTTVFLKRLPRQMKINGYNKDILELHQANIDVQFITDTYACVQYVCNYINKSTKGISKLMYDVMKDIEKRGNVSLKEKLKAVANKFINASEMSAQEAVYYCLSMHISESSKSCTFINTSHPDRRVRVVKSRKQLEKLPNGSTDIYCTEKLSYYSDRSSALENVCLADFTAEYTTVNKKQKLMNKKQACSDVENTDDENVDDVQPINNNSDNENDQNSEEEEAMSESFQLNHKKKTKRSIIRYVNFNQEVDPPNFYREQLMLFYPWRNEKKELLDVNCEELYNKYIDVINNNRKKYIYQFKNKKNILTLIDEAEKQCQNDEDDLQNDNDTDVVAPEYEMLYDDELEADIALEITSKNNGKNDHTSYEQNKNSIALFPIPHRLNDDEYYNLMRSLNDKQRKYMLHCLNHFKIASNKNNPIYEIVLGGAGVGKSRLIQAIQQSMLHYYHNLNATVLDNLQILLTAPTGKAAFNITGITLHSAFIVPLNQNANDLSAMSDNTCNKVYSKLRDLKLIIIDEISMVGTKIFHQIDSRLKQIFKSNEDFGGISVILFGDFNQLSPVADGYIFECPKNNPYAVLAGNKLWEKFKVFELTEIMRQKDDFTYAEALNRLARGCLNKDDIQMFQSRQINKKTLQKPNNCLHLFKTNNAVDAFNNKCLENADKEEIIAIDRINKNNQSIISKDTAEKLMATAKDMKLSSAYGLPYSISLAVDFHYMVTNNVNTEDGLTNGVIGTLKKVDSELPGVWMLFDNENVGKHARSEAREYMQKKNIPLNWTPIQKIVRPLLVQKKFDMTRRQFPLTPAEAITVHKSQGSTYNQIVIDMDKLTRNGLYVACSRVTSLDGLFIQGKFIAPKPPAKTNKVTIAMKELFEKRSVQLNLKFIQDYMTYSTVVYWNIQSLNKHYLDLCADSNFITAKILIIAETWYLATDEFSISNFKVLYRKDNISLIRKPYGLIICAKSDFISDYHIIYEFNQCSKNISCNIAAVNINNEFILCGLYISPKTSYSCIRQEFRQMLQTLCNKSNDKIMIVGDFNTNFNEHSNSEIFQDLNKFGFHENIKGKSSTNFNTKIDLCFVKNFDNCFSYYYENYFGHHKPINTIIVNESEMQSFIESTSNQNDVETTNNLNNTSVVEESICGEHPMQVSEKQNNEFEITKTRSRTKSGVNQPTKVIEINDELVIINDDQNDSLKAGKNKPSSIHTTRKIDNSGDLFTGILNKFENNDATSCYSNSIVQCLIHNDYVREEIKQNPTTLNQTENDALYTITMQYEQNKKQILSSYSIRQEVDSKTGNVFEYTNRSIQQDCYQYFTHILQVYHYLQTTCMVTIDQDIRCTNTSCKFKLKKSTYSNALIPYFFLLNNNNQPSSSKRKNKNSPELISSVSELIKQKFAKTKWFKDESIKCQKCNSCGNCEENQSINHCGDVIFVYMVNDSNRNIDMKCNLHEISKELLTINKYKYKLTSIIYHIGSGNELDNKGHYYCHILHNNQWIIANDCELKQCKLSTSCQNTYMLMYERVSH